MDETNFTKPKLYPTNRDLSKTWFVAFRFTNPDTGERKQFQFRSNLNEHTNAKERLTAGKLLVSSLYDMLVSGWNPFSNELEKVEEEAPVGLAEQLEQLLLLRKSVWTDRTFESYTDHRIQFTKWLTLKRYDKLLPKFFTEERAQAYMDYCIGVKKYSSKSHNTRLGALQSFFNQMQKRKLIDKSPFEAIKRLSEV